MLELRRKLFHLFSILLLSFPVLYFPPLLNYLIFTVAILINLLIVKKNKFLLKIFKVFIELFEREKNIERPAIQSLYALIGIFISYILFKEYSFYGILVLAVGDALSGLVGYYLGKRKLPYNSNKTLEGTFAFFLSSFVSLLFFLNFEKALIISLTCAFIESLKIKLDDNFTVPIIASFLAYTL